MDKIINAVKNLFSNQKTEKINAIGTEPNSVKTPNVQKRIIIDKPRPKNDELLIKISAVSVNPVDTKLLKNADNESNHVFGFDAVGIVEEIGPKSVRFKLGDRVYFITEKDKQGTNAEYVTVDEKIVSLAPMKLSDEEVSVLPLASLTAFEVLVDHLKLDFSPNAARGKKILIINGAGGVGSMLIQFAHYLGMDVTASASKANTIDWVKKLGAKSTVNHHDLKNTLKSDEKFDYVVFLHEIINQDFENIVEHIYPFGKIVAIADTAQPINIGLLKNKSVSIDWEYLFAKTMYQVDVESQGKALSKISKLADGGVITSPLTEKFDYITPGKISEIYERIENGDIFGKAAFKMKMQNDEND